MDKINSQTNGHGCGMLFAKTVIIANGRIRPDCATTFGVFDSHLVWGGGAIRHTLGALTCDAGMLGRHL